MKFLQICTFYPPYLQHFYSSRPELFVAPFELHITEILKDGFGALHLFAPYLSELGYDPLIIISNNYQSQIKWHQHYGTDDVDSKNWVLEITRQQVDIFQPDILYVTDPITFDSHFIRTLSWKPRLIVGWRAAGIPLKTDWSEFDVMLSNWTGCWKLAPQLGAKSVEYFLPAFPSVLAKETRDVESDRDVVFCGQWTDQHQYRNQLLTTVAEKLDQHKHTISYFLHLPTSTELPEKINHHLQPAVWGIDMYRTLKRGKIALNAAIDMAKGEGPNMRIFEATGSGTFLLTQNYCNLSQFFEPDVEVVAFNNEDELIEKILYYLSHPEERAAIARRGQERCLREHSIRERVLQLDEILRRHLMRNAMHNRAVDTIIETSNQQQNHLRQQVTRLQSRQKGLREKISALKVSLQRSRRKLRKEKQRSLRLNTELQDSLNAIADMKQSKFWTLRSKWIRIKKMLGISAK